MFLKHFRMVGVEMLSFLLVVFRFFLMKFQLVFIHENQQLKTNINEMFKMVANKYVWSRVTRVTWEDYTVHDTNSEKGGAFWKSYRN